MSYAYHPLSKVGAFTKGNSSVRTYQTAWDLYEAPVMQCPGCLAPNATVCVCAKGRATATATTGVAPTPTTVLDWKPEAKRVDADILRLELIERHIDRMRLIPVSLVGAYLANLPRALRLEIVSYL